MTTTLPALPTRFLRTAGAFAAIGAVAALTACGSDGESTTDSASETAAAETTANSFLDYAAVCDGTAITNAKDFAKPYRFQLFGDPDATGDRKNIVGLPTSSWYVSPTDPSPTNAVACFSSVASSEKKLMSCPFDVNGKKVTIDLISTEFKVTIRNARTGEVAGDAGTVKSKAADSCPVITTVVGGVTREILEPDPIELTRVLDSFAAR